MKKIVEDAGGIADGSKRQHGRPAALPMIAPENLQRLTNKARGRRAPNSGKNLFLNANGCCEDLHSCDRNGSARRRLTKLWSIQKKFSRCPRSSFSLNNTTLEEALSG